uniref:SFRICE_020569 n=1 Tax=Spodoptera frugiperda TaxID=7108 RepID=A0A2H1X0S3_SPOFR
MEDENTKEENQPSTSKKEARTNSANDLYNEDRPQDERASNSESSVSATYSARSRIEMADTRPEPPKPIIKREPKVPERKKRARRQGRVEKRRRSYTRRQVRRTTIRRRPRMPIEKKMRDLSVSTIFTRLSSRSGSRTPGCIHCGHRCCRRRYLKKRAIRKKCERVAKKFGKKKVVNAKRKVVNARRKVEKPKTSRKKPKLKLFARQMKCEASVSKHSKEAQYGSRTKMLSPLFIKTNSVLADSNSPPLPVHCEVTPEMIVEGLRALVSWKQNVQEITLMNFIKKFPRERSNKALSINIKSKLPYSCTPTLIAKELKSQQMKWNTRYEKQHKAKSTL